MGGGAIYIQARQFINYGTIEARGGNGEAGGFYSGGGGGGSGGSIFLGGRTLANYGKIVATGGRGGERALGSGTGGAGKGGGSGGTGRIRFDFLAIQSFGHVIPYPMNVTTHGGEVYLYRRSLVTGTWALFTVAPRLNAMQFIGHSVALDGTSLAVASDERTLVDPLQVVYLMDISQVKNASSPIHRWRKIVPPNLQDKSFGFQMCLSNNTLLIGANGNNISRGVVYVMMGRQLLVGADSTTTLQSSMPAAGDNFGAPFHYAFPELYAVLPTQNDDNPPANLRRSQGCVHHYKYLRSIAASKSFITCEHAVATANTTVNCALHTRDANDLVVGDVNDMSFFSINTTFVQMGQYSFPTFLKYAGRKEVTATFKGDRVTSFYIDVSPAIVAVQSNLTCHPTTVLAGADVTCTVRVNRGAGELNAQTYFDAIVYNMFDAQLNLASDGTVAETAKGNYHIPPSLYVKTDPLATDFPTSMPTVSFVRHGVYQFTFTAQRPGPYAAFVTYQNKALLFPNPVIVDSLDPAISAASSTLSCPTLVAPNRTLVCVVQLRSTGQVISDAPSLASNFSSPHYTTAMIGSTSFGVTGVWSGEGRVSLLIMPTITGTLSVSVKYHNQLISSGPVTVTVSSSYPQTCRSTSLLLQSFTTLNQHTLGYGDAAVYGGLATNALIVDGAGLCDTQRV